MFELKVNKEVVVEKERVRDGKVVVEAGEYVYYDMALIYSDDRSEIEFSPEDSEIMRNLDPQKLDGLDFGCANGECFMSLKDECITFCTAKYGDGNGGKLVIKVKKTPELMASLTNCLIEWKSLIEQSGLVLSQS